MSKGLKLRYEGPTMKRVAYNHARANLEDCMYIHNSDSIQVWGQSSNIVMFVGILEPRDEDEAVCKIADILDVDIIVKSNKQVNRRRQITFIMNWQDYIATQLAV